MSFENATSALTEPPATLAPLVPEPAPRTRRRRSGAAGSLAAQGEPWVWLAGGALVVAIAMIVGLLAFILVQGLITFWPKAVVEFKTDDGQVILGEVSQQESYVPSAEDLNAAPQNVAARAKRILQESGGTMTQRLVRTSTGGKLVNEAAVASEDTPEWALSIEREKGSTLFATPAAFLIDGQEEAVTPAEAWDKFNEYHGAARRRFYERVRIATDAFGDLSEAQRAAQIAVVRAELSDSKDSDAYRAAVAEEAGVNDSADKEKAKLNEQIALLNKENSRYALRVGTADGKTSDLPLDQIVRAYPANQLGFWGRLGVYLSRWREFLFENPRESNSAGGVYPAIWGTVAMTLILAVLVVPFGVLAALYLREYAKAGPIVSAVRIAINNLAGVPSVVFGVFGLGFFCYGIGRWIDSGTYDLKKNQSGGWPWPTWWTLLTVLIVAAALATYFAYRLLQSDGGTKPRVKRRALGRASLALWLGCAALAILLVANAPFFHGFYLAETKATNNPVFGGGGLLWASLTLALLTLPVVIVATEEALAAVPKSMREGSYACGASKWQTIWRIVLPRALPGILTGMILAMARGAGEVAPLMLVGVKNFVQQLPVDHAFPFFHPQRSIMHLGFHIYSVSMQSVDSEASRPLVFTTTLLLIAIIATLNIAAIWLRARLRRKFVASHF